MSNPDHDNVMQGRRTGPREPMFTGLDMLAFLVSLVMVCMPLAFGALGYR